MKPSKAISSAAATAAEGAPTLIPRTPDPPGRSAQLFPLHPPHVECSPTLDAEALARTLDLTHDQPGWLPTRLRSQYYCMRSSIVGQNPDRTEAVIIPLPCKSWDCAICGPRKRARWIDKLELGKPERELTLTCPVGKFPDSHAAARAMKAAWTILVPRIRKYFGSFEYALVWELTRKGVPHCHILTRGSYLPQTWISRQWDRLGIGPVVYIRSLKHNPRAVSHACKYLAKSNGQTAKSLAPLRLIQISKGYIIPDPRATVPARYPDYVWSWDRRPQPEIIRTFERSPWLLDIQFSTTGEARVRMRPHPIPPDMIAYPEYWVASPGYNLPRDFWES